MTNLRSGAHAQLTADLLSLSPDAESTLTRNTFDRLVPLVLPATPSLHALKYEAARALIRLVKQREWELDREQAVTVLMVGVRWAEWTKSAASPVGDRGGAVHWKELRRVAERAVELAKGDDVEVKERAEVGELVKRMGLARLKRAPPGRTTESTATDDRPEPPSTAAAAFAVKAYREGIALSQPCATATPTPQGTKLLTALLTSHPSIALRHLDHLLAANLIPTLSGLEAFLLSPAATPSHLTADGAVDPYAYARSVLDSACDGGGRSRQAQDALEELLAARLRRIERDAAVAREPMLGFLRWMAEEWTGVELSGEARGTSEGVGKAEAVGAALRVWRTVYGQGRADQVPHAAAMQALELLIKDACAIQAEQHGSGPAPLALRATRLAAELSVAHLPPARLSDLSHKLLTALAVDSADTDLAHSFYHSLRTSASSSSPKPFQWHTSLRRAFASLILGADKADQPERVMQLYLDWTGDGLVLPDGLWTHVWRAAGRRSLVEEVARLVADHEDAGRGRVPARLVRLVMEASAGERRVVKTLRLLSYWRARPRNVGAFGGGGRSVVPLEAYEAVLAMLSTSATDRRAAGMEIFSAAMSEGHRPTTTTWNQLLAAQVFRPAFHVEDIDNAGLAFNSLVQARCAPDARTYSLLVHGFLRLARSRQGKSGVGLHAALMAYGQAVAGGLRVRGEGVAGLMRELGRRGRWDEAKEVGEGWWRLVERGEGRVADGEARAVRGAAEDVEEWEARASESGVARGEADRGAEREGEGGEGEAEVGAAEGLAAGEGAADEQSAEAFGDEVGVQFSRA